MELTQSAKGLKSSLGNLEDPNVQHPLHEDTLNDFGTIVIQPYELSGIHGETFIRSLNQALIDNASVIVDLLWVDSLEASALNLLVTGMQSAQTLGKTLSFLSLDATHQRALDALWEKTQVSAQSYPCEIYTPAFEQFLDRHYATKLAANLKP